MSDMYYVMHSIVRHGNNTKQHHTEYSNTYVVILTLSA